MQAQLTPALERDWGAVLNAYLPCAKNQAQVLVVQHTGTARMQVWWRVAFQ